MSLGTSLAGVITFFLGLAGLLDYYGHPVFPFSLTVISVLFTPAGTFLLYGLVAVIGAGLIVGGFVEGEEETKLTVRDLQKHLAISQSSRLGLFRPNLTSKPTEERCTETISSYIHIDAPSRARSLSLSGADTHEHRQENRQTGTNENARI